MKRISDKRRAKLLAGKEERIKMKLFFFICWSEWDKISEVSGAKVYGEASTVYHHHVLPKSTHPEVKYLPHNIISMTWDEHTLCESDPDRYEIVRNRRKEILNNYERYVSLAKQFEEDILNPLYESLKHHYDNE